MSLEGSGLPLRCIYANAPGCMCSTGCYLLVLRVVLWESMPSYPPFPNAPLVEALLDIQVSPHAGAAFHLLESFCDAVAADYPERRHRKEWRTDVRVSDDGDATGGALEGGVVGYVVTSKDGKQIAQARLNGFSFSRLRPYRDWDQFIDEAERLWRVYVETMAPAAIHRIALRYINRLEIPLPFVDFREYVLTAPDVAPGLPQGLSHFLMQLHFPSPEHEAVVIVTETVEPPIDDNKRLPFILDIDAVRTGDLEISDDTLWQKFERLHELKNQVFFLSTTEKAKELFK